MKNQNEIKWIDGRLIQGAYRQWLIDTHQDEALELKAIDIIARNTLGYRKRYGYIKEELFRMSHNKKWRQIKKLEKINLLTYKKTKGFTMYNLVLPEEIENKVQWSGKQLIQNENNNIQNTVDDILEGFYKQ